MFVVKVAAFTISLGGKLAYISSLVLPCSFFALSSPVLPSIPSQCILSSLYHTCTDRGHELDVLPLYCVYFLLSLRWMNRLGLAAIGYTPDDPVPRPDEGENMSSLYQQLALITEDTGCRLARWQRYTAKNAVLIQHNTVFWKQKYNLNGVALTL